jgi:putative membrane protein
MPDRFLKKEDKAALTSAVEALESRSSAEVVVLVRPRSGEYLHADLLMSALVGWLVLAVQLFSPWEFGLTEILVAPPAFGLAAALLTSRVARLRRWLTTTAERRELVRTGAQSAFFERGIDKTRDRTGILVYVSLLERMAEVVADRGVRLAVPEAEWTEGVARVDAAVRAGEPGAAVAGRLLELGGLLERRLPRREDDVDELPNTVGAA